MGGGDRQGELVLPVQDDAIPSVAFSPDGRTLASTGSDNTVLLWEVATGKQTGLLHGHANAVTCLAFSPDGRLLATGSWDDTARLWQVATGKEIAVLRAHEDQVNSVAFSPDGRTLATGADDKTARLWEVATGKEIAVLPVHELITVESVAFSPDGRTLAAGSVLWEVASGKKIAVLSDDEHWVHSVAFSPDGGLLATGSVDKVRLWPVGQHLVDLACARVHDLPLSDRDKQRFGIEDEWCTREVSGALRARLGLDAPDAAPPPASAAR